jgi:uncharacterized protein YqgC (DUF456 family)
LLLRIFIPDSISWTIAIIFSVLTIVITILDYVLPVWGAKRYKASNHGIWGSIIGMLIGMIFFPPWGMILGLLFGAVIGELIAGKKNSEAFKVGIVTFIASLIMIIAKLILSGIMTFYFMLETVYTIL